MSILAAPGVADELGDYAQLAAARKALAADLKRDPATMARGLDPGYRMRPHLRVMGDAMVDILDGTVDRLMILTPAQVGKSTTVAEWGPVWWFANRPTDDIVIASYGEDLAVDRSKGVRSKITQYGADFDLELLRGSSAASDWETTTGGHLRATGVGGGLSGFPANLIIIDDPHKDRAEADSPRMRKWVHNWWSSAVISRLQPDRGAVIIIMTRWHEDDLAGRRLKDEGRIEDGGRWKVVHLPAFADPRFGPDPLGRRPGAPLTHPKIPTSDMARLTAWWNDKRSGMTNRDWHAMCQGDPKPLSGALVDENLFSRIRQFTDAADPLRIGVAVDPSGGGRDAAGVVGGYLGVDQRLWITDDRSAAMSSAEWSEAACILAYEIDATFIVVEINFGADMATLVVKTAWEKLQREGVIPLDALPPLIKMVRAKRNKLLRAEPIAQQMLSDHVRMLGYFPELEREWETWVATDPASPGRIDASTYLAYALLPIPMTGAEFSVPAGSMPTTDASPLGQGSATGASGGSGFGPLG